MTYSRTSLYDIEGTPGPALDRVRAAMTWLTSEAAHHIGNDLLKEAYDRTNRHLKIIVTDHPILLYANGNGEHTIYVNPHYANSVRFTDEQGAVHPISLEQMLGHELKHASQDLADPAVMIKVSGELNKVGREAYNFARNHNGNKKETTALYHETKNTPYYFTATQNIEKLLDISDKMKPIADNYLQLHPYFIQYMEGYELPALAVEKQIATLRNEPFRENYNHTYREGDASRDTDREDYHNQFNVIQKFGIPPLATEAQNNTWMQVIKSDKPATFSKWTPNAEEHPLIAQHLPGGRS